MKHTIPIMAVKDKDHLLRVQSIQFQFIQLLINESNKEQKMSNPKWANHSQDPTVNT